MVAYVFASYGGLLLPPSPLLYAIWVMRHIDVDIQHNYVEMQHTWSRMLT